MTTNLRFFQMPATTLGQVPPGPASIPPGESRYSQWTLLELSRPVEHLLRDATQGGRHPPGRGDPPGGHHRDDSASEPDSVPRRAAPGPANQSQTAAMVRPPGVNCSRSARAPRRLLAPGGGAPLRRDSERTRTLGKRAGSGWSGPGPGPGARPPGPSDQPSVINSPGCSITGFSQSRLHTTRHRPTGPVAPCS
jgi:hypothetical protein